MCFCLFFVASNGEFKLGVVAVFVQGAFFCGFKGTPKGAANKFPFLGGPGAPQNRPPPIKRLLGDGYLEPRP